MIDTTATDGIATVRMQRTHVHNALDRATLGRLLEAVDGVLADPDTRVLVLAGCQTAFSTGDDLREAAEASSADFSSHIDAFQRLTSTLRRAAVPTIASVSGYAYGGGLEIAVSCDARIAAANARFACPEVRWGITPTNASSVLLRRLVGDGWARELLLFGRTVDAEEAHGMGLVTRVAPVADLDRHTREFADAAASGSPTALALTKGLLNRDDAGWLEEVLDAEAAAVMSGFACEEAQERLRSFAGNGGAT